MLSRKLITYTSLLFFILAGSFCLNAQTYSILYTFPGPPDGFEPLGTPILDETSNVYGTTEYGGQFSQGNVYKVDQIGNETVLYSFTPSGSGDGQLPSGRLLRDRNGVIYGTTQFGGTFGYGTIYSVASEGTDKVLYSFTGGADGWWPRSGVVADPEGNLYGSTSSGTGTYCPACGAVFKLDRQGNLTVLHTFTNGMDGGSPSGVILDPSGNLYGTTVSGGRGYGVVFRIDPSGSETILYAFSGRGGSLSSPCSGLVRDRYGNLYGITAFGHGGRGGAYKLFASGKLVALSTVAGSGGNTFPACSDLTIDSSGNLYGTTFFGGSGSGALFQIDPKGTGTVLYAFPSGMGFPATGVALDAAGNIYGTVLTDQTNGQLFKFTK